MYINHNLLSYYIKELVRLLYIKNKIMFFFLFDFYFEIWTLNHEQFTNSMQFKDIGEKNHKLIQ